MAGPILAIRLRQRRPVAIAARGPHIRRHAGKDYADGNDRRISHPRAARARLAGAQRSGDPEAGIPGCQTIEKVSDTEFTAKVVAKVGPVKATFGGKVTLTDLDPPKATRSPARAPAGSPASPRAAPRSASTRTAARRPCCATRSQAHVGGKLAQIGSRLIDATSRKMAEDFFSRFVAAVSRPSGARHLRRAAAGAAAGPPKSPHGRARESALRPRIRAGGRRRRRAACRRRYGSPG